MSQFPAMLMLMLSAFKKPSFWVEVHSGEYCGAIMQYVDCYDDVLVLYWPKNKIRVLTYNSYCSVAPYWP